LIGEGSRGRGKIILIHLVKELTVGGQAGSYRRKVFLPGVYRLELGVGGAGVHRGLREAVLLTGREDERMLRGRSRGCHRALGMKVVRYRCTSELMGGEEVGSVDLWPKDIGAGKPQEENGPKNAEARDTRSKLSSAREVRTKKNSRRKEVRKTIPLEYTRKEIPLKV